MTRSYVNTAIHNGGDPTPKVRTNDQYDGYWFDVIADGHEVTFHCQSLHGLREFARQLNLEIDEQERQAERRQTAIDLDAKIRETWNAAQVSSIPVTSRVDPIAAQIEAEGPMPAVSPEDAAEILAATDIDSWTVTEGTHSELPDRLKPKRKPIWDQFEHGDVPPGGTADALEYARWKLAGGKVKEDVTMTPEEKAAIPF